MLARPESTFCGGSGQEADPPLETRINQSLNHAPTDTFAYCAPVYRLPVELLRQIFLDAAGDSPIPLLPSFPSSTQFRVAAVCSQWRYTILDLPEVWSNIAFSTAWSAEVALERSITCALLDAYRFYVDEGFIRITDIPTALRVLDLLLSRCGTHPLQFQYRHHHLERESWGLLKSSPINTRISKLHVATCVTQLGRIPRLATWLGSPALREVHIQGIDCHDSSGRECWSPPRVSLNVESFILEDVVPTRHLFEEVQRPSLRHFQLVHPDYGEDRDCYLPILDYLFMMPKLKSLDIRRIDFVDQEGRGPAQLATDEPVLLEELEHLRVTGWRASLWWVAYLVTPKLKVVDVQICGSGPASAAMDSIPTPTPGMLSQWSTPRLTSLVVRCWAPDIPILLTRVAPTLERLVTFLHIWEQHLDPADGIRFDLPSLRKLDLVDVEYPLRLELQAKLHRTPPKQPNAVEYTLEMRKRVCRSLAIYALKGSEAVAPALERVSVFRYSNTWSVGDMGTALVTVSKHEDTQLHERGEPNGSDGD